MGQRAHGNPIHAAIGDRAQGLQRDAAAGLEEHGGGEGVSKGHGFSHHGRVHVIEQDHIDPRHCKQALHLLQRVCFNLDR